MLANDMKKGQLGTMRGTGWRFEIADNKKGVIRMATVDGAYKEMGSIYIHDIESLDNADGTTGQIEFTPAQEKQIAAIKGAGY